MLTIQDLKLAYGSKVVLNQMTLEVAAGESVAIIGPSGCGKSTLLYAVAGFLLPQQGEIRIHNEPLAKMQKSVGLALQDNNLFPWLTVYKNLSLGLKARGYNKDEIQKKIGDIAQELCISHLLGRYPLSLSGGERQRVAIGCILVWEPRLVLLDEPSSALDALHKERFQDFILELRKRHKPTMLFVTHSMEEAIVLGQKILIMLPNGTYKLEKNELYGLQSIREKPVFFEKCLEIRSWLKLEENPYEN